MRGWWIAGLALLAMAAPAAAQSAWHEASSEHFVVYAEDGAEDIGKFSQQLERFHRAMELVTGFDPDTPSPSNRVTVFMVGGNRQVRQLAGDGSSQVAGFYIPRAGGSVAYVPQVEADTRDLDFSMVILLHEYAHHFLLSNTAFPTPRWFDEGAAEFFAAAEFGRDGSLKVGMPARHRAGELLYARDVSVAELVDPAIYRAERGDAFYGKSWLLYHYLTFAEDRRGQLQAYLAAMHSGQGSREAAEQAFGPLKTLDSNLDRYMRQRTMSSLVLPADRLGEPAIAVRRLSAGEVAMMPVRLRSRRGVTREQALELLAEARAVAARFPDDPAVQAALAEAEFDAGNDAEAIAAADAAIARNPQEVNAYVQKGYALFRRAFEAGPDGKEAAYEAAMQPFVALNRFENDHPLPLIYFYLSFTQREAEPSPLAVQGLERAVELAPFDLGLRLTLARQQALDGRVAAARANLVPAAYNPHGGGLADHARKVMEALATGALSQAEVEALFAGSPEEDGDADDG